MADILGSDIQLDSSGDLMASSSGDFLICEGVANLKQAILITTSTPFESILDSPGFGCDLYSFVGMPNSAETRARAINEIKSALEADPRIEKIAKLTATKKTDTSFDVEAIVVPTMGDSFVNTVLTIEL